MRDSSAWRKLCVPFFFFEQGYFDDHFLLAPMRSLSVLNEVSHVHSQTPFQVLRKKSSQALSPTRTMPIVTETKINENLLKMFFCS